MKKFTFLFVAVLFFACTKQEQDQVAKSQCLNPVSLKIKTMEYESPNRQWVKNYFYDSADRVVKIEDTFLEGRIFDLTYSGDNLTRVDVSSMATSTLDRVDSLGYDGTGAVVSAYTFSLNPLKDDFADWTFEYNDDGKIKQLSSNWRIVKFTWTGDNISKVEHFDENQERLYDLMYEFDDKVNYQKGLYQTHLYAAYNFMRPEYWNQNNITNWDRLDHIDFQNGEETDGQTCPCPISYEYNDQCHPTTSDDRGTIRKITYH